MTILPQHIETIIASRLNRDKLYEVRLRVGMPVVVNYNGRYRYLSASGLMDTKEGAVCASVHDVAGVVVRATEYSLYAVNDQLRFGYITVTGGVRVGVCGEAVTDGAQVKTVKNFTSVNVRYPHQVKGCALPAYRCLFANGLCSALIVGPPGCGKTTILRDLSDLIGNRTPPVNLMIIDERCELASLCHGKPTLDVGQCTDVLAGCKKSYAFTYAIRSMRPDIVVTDELAGGEDLDSVAEAAVSGVAVIASVHARDMDDLLRRPGFAEAADKRLFDRYVVLSERNGPGTYEGIFDENLHCLDSCL